LILEFLDQILHPQGKQFDTARILQMIKSGQYSTAFNSLALYLNNCARKLSLCTSAATRAPLVRSLLHFREKLVLATIEVSSEGQVSTPATPTKSERPATIEAAIARVYQLYVGRSPVLEEIEIWKNNFKNGLPFHEFFLAMESGEEAKQHSQRQSLLGDVCDGEFVQTSYELIMGRGAAAWEIEGWLSRLERGELNRAEVLAKLFEAANKFFISLANEPRHDGLSCWVMGTGTHVSAADWQGKAKALREEPIQKSEPDNRYTHRFHIKSEPRVLVSALASMYRGGDFIEQFMDNITSLDGFDDYCELIIVDADSPENESETIKRYLASHKNINYIRCNYRIGIYDAWNVAAKAARGDYLTNTNLDDLRRHDSFMLQAATLDNLPFVDVVYQDLYYTFDPRLSFDEIVPFGLQSVMPVITPHNLIKFNSPHNAPMWRRKLHEDLGYFDTFYKSAGDYEFWMRCLAAGKKFYKINDPHVVYYQNPKGLSTRPDTRGIAESMEIHKVYCRKLIAREVVMPCQEFIQKLDPGGTAGILDNTQDRYVLAQQALRNVARRQKYQMTSRGLE
jgi:glycosyltransferase involved in cell wall biosynthesis